MVKFIIAGQYVQVKSSYFPQLRDNAKALRTRQHNKELKALGVSLGNEPRQKRQDNLSRVRNRLKLLAHANASNLSKFITLTSQENTSMEQFQEWVRLWLRQLKRDLMGLGQGPKNKRGAYSLKYVGAYELQERGAPHLHLIFFNEEFINWELALKRWRSIIGGLGSVQIKRLEAIKHINYIVSYLNEGMVQKFGKKSVLRSIGLKEPKIYKDNIPNHLKNLSLKVDYARMMGSSQSGATFRNIDGTKSEFISNSFENVFGYLTRTTQGENIYSWEQVLTFGEISITRINAFNKSKRERAAI